MRNERVIEIESHLRKAPPFVDDFGVTVTDPISGGVAALLDFLTEAISLFQYDRLNRSLCRMLWAGRSQLEADYHTIKNGCFVPGGIESAHRMRITLTEIRVLLRQGDCGGDEVLAARRDTVMMSARELDRDLCQALRSAVPLRRIGAHRLEMAG